MAKVREGDLKPQVYKDPRPAEYFQHFHERARQPIGWTYELVRAVVAPLTIAAYRLRAIGMENAPTHGKVIFTPNHFSTMDHFFAASFLHRKVQFMAKSQLFGNPILNYIFKYGGVFPVRRGHNDVEAMKTAHSVLEREQALLMYAEGGRSRSGELGTPKRGVGLIALQSGAPVVPVAIHGSAAVRGWKRGQLPRVTVQFGLPMSFPTVADPSREQQQEVADQVFDKVRGMYVALEEQGRSGVVRALREGLPPGASSRKTADA